MDTAPEHRRNFRSQGRQPVHVICVSSLTFKPGSRGTGKLDKGSQVDGKGFVAVGLPGWSHWKDAWTKDFIGKEVILVMDADEGGKKGTADIAKRFMRAGLPCPRQLVLTKGKDLNELLQSFRN